jgi:hypothetical protein
MLQIGRIHFLTEHQRETVKYGSLTTPMPWPPYLHSAIGIPIQKSIYLQIIEELLICGYLGMVVERILM